jgi:hypothetical protein
MTYLIRCESSVLTFYAFGRSPLHAVLVKLHPLDFGT